MLGSISQRFSFVSQLSRYACLGLRAASDTGGYHKSDAAESFAALINTRCAESDGLFRNFESNSINVGLGKLGVESLDGLCVLDAGCGDGRLCREMAGLGASAIGCDSSATLIQAAIDAKREQPHDAEYILTDVSKPDTRALPKVDLSLSIYVAQMCPTREELLGMCRFLSEHSSKCLLFSVNGEYSPRRRQSELMQQELGFQSLRKSGTTDRILFTMGSVVVENYQYPQSVYLDCLVEAGFTDVGSYAFHGPDPFHDRVAQTGTSDQKELLELLSENPHVKCFWAAKDR